MEDFMAIPLKPGRHFLVDYVEKPAGYEMPFSETYHDYYGVGYIISGDRKFITPNMIYMLHAGAVGFTNIELPHRSACASTQDYIRYGIRFSPEIIDPIKKAIGNDRFSYLFSQPFYFDDDTRAVILKIFQDSYDEYLRYDEMSELVLKGYLSRIVSLVLRKSVTDIRSEPLRINYNETITNAIYYIDTHFRENPSLEQTAAHVHLSPSHFSKLFKATVNCTYSAYLLKTRLQFADTLLIQTDMSITEIALQSGFSNSNYFCDVFRKSHGMSPSQYRKSY